MFTESLRLRNSQGIHLYSTGSMVTSHFVCMFFYVKEATLTLQGKRVFSSWSSWSDNISDYPVRSAFFSRLQLIFLLIMEIASVTELSYDLGSVPVSWKSVFLISWFVSRILASLTRVWTALFRGSVVSSHYFCTACPCVQRNAALFLVRLERMPATLSSECPITDYSAPPNGDLSQWLMFLSLCGASWSMSVAAWIATAR